MIQIRIYNVHNIPSIKSIDKSWENVRTLGLRRKAMILLSLDYYLADFTILSQIPLSIATIVPSMCCVFVAEVRSGEYGVYMTDI